ncbi:MAG: helix-hairpin-helix domain-containing protein, partial [Croceimicrobium sp.]
WMNQRLSARAQLRRLFEREAQIQAKLVKTKEEEAQKFRDYFDFSDSLKRIPGHRLLAIRRGEKEGFLRVNIAPDEEGALDILDRIFRKANNAFADQVSLAAKDAYKRLIRPSLESEFAAASKQKADENAIVVFAENLKQLLLNPPLGPKRILAIDPGFRTGCKVVCLDEQGSLLHNDTIYPHPPQKETSRAAAKIAQLAEAYKIEAIAIGNGTAGRETEEFISKRVRFKYPLEAYVVNEAGASIYSASKIAREEFPTYDVTVRGSVSIGRRLMDPLAELVKIDPKSIGVGQYQHDVDQSQLKASLDRIVEQVVNAVGVNLNTSSKHLLEYVSGLGPALAERIVAYREEHGPFKNRKELLKVPKLGPKAFEQAAGFLRIPQAANPLDNSGVHPERYSVVETMAADLKKPLSELIGQKEILDRIDLNPYCKDDLGLPTLKDIISELAKHGRDPRGKARTFQFDPRIRSINDLKEGMILPGLVSNITNFGAFVDVGAKQDGLVHVSELANRFVRDPNEIVRLQQQVQVKVISIDTSRKRIQFSMKQV